MENSPIKRRYAVLITGYGAFALLVPLIYTRLTRSIGMDALLAFLLSHCFGVLVLYYMRKTVRRIDGGAFSSNEYGAFLLVNAVAVLIGALVLYSMGYASLMNGNGTTVHIFTTGACIAANILLQIFTK